jgi:uncharacterized membrane protein HdeD (DUF308 family)
MNTTLLDGGTLAMRVPMPNGKRASLLKLYLVRGLLAVAWAGIFAGAHATLDTLAIVLLVVYPLIDAASSLIDYRTMPNGSGRRVIAFNGMLSTLAAIAMGVAGGIGVAAALAVFGAWAIVSGAAQLIVGLRRRGPELGRQWPMLIAGGLSFLVGVSYVVRAAGDRASLDVLAVYATGGGVFFIVQALLLAWRSRQRRRAAN